MSDFAKKIVIFSSIQLCLAVCVFTIYQPDRQTYLGATRYKHKRLNVVASPRIIAVGGSGLMFCLQSELLEQEFGIPVVNMGLNGALALHYKLAEVESAVRSEDIVLLSLEYEHYSEAVHNVLIAARLLEQRPANVAFFDLRWPLFKAILDDGLDYVRFVGQMSLRGVLGRGTFAVAPYTLDSFNTQGDIVAHRTMAAREITAHVAGLSPVSPRVLDRLKTFVQVVKSRGGTPVLFHPPIHDAVGERWGQKLTVLQRQLESSLNIAILNSPSEQHFPKELLFDTIYHCNGPGGLRNTQQLATRLTQTALRPEDSH